MIEITIDGSHADIAESDSDLFVLYLIAYEVSDLGNRSVMRNELRIYDATLPVIEDKQYTVGSSPKIIEFDHANFINWQPTVVSYKAFIIDNDANRLEITTSKGDVYPIATFD